MKPQSRLFHWQPTRETFYALSAGVMVIVLSAAMRWVKEVPWASIFIRDVLQIYLVGILFPLLCMRRQGFSAFGFHLKKWGLYLSLDLILGALLLVMFLKESSPPVDFRFNITKLWTASYVMLALCFELVFFYAFLRTLLAQAFGAPLAVTLTALFYAFHHIGFQPEYGKLIFVGLMYATACQLAGSILLIFPFFLGVGGVYDVLIQSQVVSPVLYPEIRTLYLAVLILSTALWVWLQRPAKNS
jgi:membrane protease YdiL (CAAX protease family)